MTETKREIHQLIGAASVDGVEYDTAAAALSQALRLLGTVRTTELPELFSEWQAAKAALVNRLHKDCVGQ